MIISPKKSSLELGSPSQARVNSCLELFHPRIQNLKILFMLYTFCFRQIDYKKSIQKNNIFIWKRKSWKSYFSFIYSTLWVCCGYSFLNSSRHCSKSSTSTTDSSTQPRRAQKFKNTCCVSRLKMRSNIKLLIVSFIFNVFNYYSILTI